MSSNDDFENYAAKWDKLWVEHYDKDIKRNLPEPDITLKDVLQNWVNVHPDKSHIIYKDRILTYKESNALACKLANALIRLGCKKGDRLSIILPNIPEVIISFMACYKTGMIAVGYNYRSTEAEMQANFIDNGAETIIAETAYADKVINILREGKTSVKNVIVLDCSEEQMKNTNVLDFYQLIDKEEEIEPDIEVLPDDLQLLLYTGGTTGISKGCCHTNRTIIGHAHAFMNWFSSALGKEDFRVLMCLPMSHAYGIHFGINWCLVTGGTVICLSTPSSDAIIEAMNKYEPTLWPSVPALINQIVYYPKVSKSKLWALKVVVCGGAPVAEDTLTLFKQYTKAKVVEGYGMSEAIDCISFNPIGNGGKTGSIGIPFPDTDVLIVHIEDGKTVMPPGQKGEIIFRGPQMIKEYWNQPEETAYAIRSGWMYTGDIGYMDKDGCMYIVDRKKDMITVGGFNVFPREIDELLYKHPKIYSSCTVGAPEPRLGEIAMSFIVVKPNEKLTAEEVIEYCRESLTAYKVPKLIKFVNEIPLTKANKPDKMALKNMAREITLNNCQGKSGNWLHMA
jgi:long-chain acyl-CoA synthetase